MGLLLFRTVVYADLPEFGALFSGGEGHIIFSLSDGSPIKKKYCLIELRAKGKKIHWISHPLEELYVRRQPKYILNFDDKAMLVVSVEKNKKDQKETQVHLYKKPIQELVQIAGSSCGEVSSIEIYRNQIKFVCGSKKETSELKDEIRKLFSQFISKKGKVFENSIYEVSGKKWKFRIVETDYYFKDNLHIFQNGLLVKKYKAKDFLKCFKYETLEGSQEKFSK